MKTLCMSSAIAITLLLVAVDAHAGDLKKSKWDTVYQTASGGEVNAVVKLNGKKGTYKTEGGGKGKLMNVKIGPPGDDDPAGVTVIKGKWNYQNGKTGTFKWYVNGAESRFNGHWRYTDDDDDDPLRSWDGDRL